MARGARQGLGGDLSTSSRGPLQDKIAVGRSDPPKVKEISFILQP